MNVVLVQCTNAPLIIKLLDFYSNFLEELLQSGIVINYTDAYIIITMLFDRLASSNSLLKNKAKAIMRQAFLACGISLVLEIVSETILTTKNLKSVAPCLEEVCILLEKGGEIIVVSEQLHLERIYR